jgi:putative DNA primase/helicase
VNASDFLSGLWTPTPPGLILTWELATKQSRWLKAPAGAIGIAPGTPDLYTGVGLAHKDHGRTRRTPNSEVIAIPGLWADIDVNGGPDEKTGAAPDRDAAIELANAILEPTVLVDSGYGVQGWWLFPEPWKFASREEQAEAATRAAQWQKALRDKAGFGLDYTHDLARVMRLPGTINAKGGQRKSVRVVAVGPRHDRAVLFALCEAAGAVDPGYRMHEVPTVSVECRPETRLPRHGALLENSAQFRRTWRHERTDLPSMSEYDLSLASIAALAGWSDQAIADMVCVHRRQQDPSDPKAERVDYVSRTVQRARQQAQPEPEITPMKGTFESDAWASLILGGLEKPDSGATALPFRPLTEALSGGLRPGEVCLVAGWTSHGKSVFVDQVADKAAEQGRRVHLYLTEMTAYERGLRLLARRTQIPFRDLRQREIDPSDWTRIVRALSELPYGCSIVSDWGVEDVVGHIAQNHWDVAVVDLVHGFHYQDERDLSKTSSALVRAAKASADGEFPGTAIIAAAHLNDGQMRNSHSNIRPRPGLHSIKGASSLKQDADTVIFVWREDNEDGVPQAHGSIWIAKARNGALGGVEVMLDTKHMEFVELMSMADVV